VVEVCWNWPVAIELLEGLLDEVKLAHPLKVKAIVEARVKTDSIDYKTLAYLLRADLIPEVYLREKGNLQRQKILKFISPYQLFCQMLQPYGIGKKQFLPRESILQLL